MRLATPLLISVLLLFSVTGCPDKAAKEQAVGPKSADKPPDRKDDTPGKDAKDGDTSPKKEDTGGVSEETIATFKKLDASFCGHAWNRNASLEWSFDYKPGQIPSFMFTVDKGKTLPSLPDPGVPVAL